MSLITRQGKGSKLTIQEMDNNLKYLNGSLISRDVIDSYILEDDTEIYKGLLYEVFDEPVTSVSLKYNTDESSFQNIVGEFGYSYILTGNVAYNSNSSYNNLDLYTRTMSNLDYVSGDLIFRIGSGFNTFVSTIKVQSDGKILVGGGFDRYNGVNANRIIRLNQDGSVDETFSTGSGFNTSVISIQVQSDGKILVGGAFDVYDGISVNRIIRLNSDGTTDTTSENKFITFTNLPNITMSVDEENETLDLVFSSPIDRMILDFKLIKSYGSFSDNTSYSS